MSDKEAVQSSADFLSVSLIFCILCLSSIFFLIYLIVVRLIMCLLIFYLYIEFAYIYFEKVFVRAAAQLGMDTRSASDRGVVDEYIDSFFDKEWL